MTSRTLNVGSDGMGRWIFHLVDPLLQRTFPNTQITHNENITSDLVIRSMFHEKSPAYTCPYITWSGESFPTSHLMSHSPICEINTFINPNIQNNIYIPLLVGEIRNTVRPDVNNLSDKKYCCSYAFSHSVNERDRVFRTMRSQEPTCYAFGDACRTSDNPFELPREKREENHKYFHPFLFNVAMENKVVPGYLTEKIGYAFRSGSIPIYWGDDATVNDFFNPESFLNVNNYRSPEDAALAAIEIWRDPQKAQKFLDAPICLNHRLSDYEALYDLNSEDRPWMIPFMNILRDTFPDLS